MVPSLGTAIDVAFYGRDAPTFVEPPGRRVVVAAGAIVLGAVVTLAVVLRFDVGTAGSIVLSYVVIFSLLHTLGYFTHLLGLAGDADDEG